MNSLAEDLGSRDDFEEPPPGHSSPATGVIPFRGVIRSVTILSIEEKLGVG